MQQGTRGSATAFPGKPAGGAAASAALPAPGKTQQLSQPPGIQTMSQQKAEPPNMPNIQTVSQKTDQVGVPAAPPGIQTVLQAVQGTLPAPRPLPNGSKPAAPALGGPGMCGVPTGAGEVGGSNMIQSPPQQRQHQAAVMAAPGAATSSGLQPAPVPGMKHAGFVARRLQAISGPVLTGTMQPPGMQVMHIARPSSSIGRPQPATVLQNGMHVVGQLRPQRLQMEALPVRPFQPGTGQPQPLQNGTVVLRSPGVLPGAVPVMRPPGYR